MRAEAFVDTNILVYAVEGLETPKPQTARELLRRPDLALSVQVLNEFYHTVTSPRRERPLSHQEAIVWLELWKRFPVQDLTLRVHEAGVRDRDRYRIGIYDAMIVAAARALGCRTILSEDLNEGQDYGGVVAMNPFARRSGAAA
jgi:predicted nucleic acid-binding protein